MEKTFKWPMRSARANVKLTQQELAKKLHVTKQTIVNWESGITSPTVEQAIAYCEACNVPFDQVSFLRERNAI